jgi:hypothetical protein
LIAALILPARSHVFVFPDVYPTSRVSLFGVIGQNRSVVCALSIEHMCADPGRPSPFDQPRRSNARTVIEKRSAGWIGRGIKQQFCGDHECQAPTVPVARPVAFSIAPPGELARRRFTALTYDAARRCGKLSAMNAIENGPAHGDHTAAAFTPGFPVQREGKAMLLLFPGRRISVVCTKLGEEKDQYCDASTRHRRALFRQGNISHDQHPFDL